MARAIIFTIDKYNDDKPINIGTGQEISIKSLALKNKKIVGYDGKSFLIESIQTALQEKG